MPNEQPIAPPHALNPPGAITTKGRRWAIFGVLGLAFLSLIFSMRKAPAPPQPTAQRQQPQTPPTALVDAPAASRHTQSGYGPMSAQTPTVPTQYAYQPQPVMQPMQTQPQMDRGDEDRKNRETEAAWADSVVKRPEVPKSELNGANSASTVALPRPTVPTLKLPEGTIINGTLENRLNGDFSGPVKVLISNDVYDPDTQQLVIPQGAEALGEAAKVSGFGQSRLAVAFHRIRWSGHSVSLDKAPGLDQQGATALHDQVNNHWASIFGASLAVGAIGGLAQIGNGYSGFGYDPSVEIRNGITQGMAQSSTRILDRFLNRMPTITIREGAPVNIYVTEDIAVPYEPLAQ